ncbi:MAG TPA: MAPEG family protein [Pseudomonadales bacterium]|jgi:glutathione S-transferase
MGDYVYPGILSSLALLVYYFTLFKAGMARGKYNIPAPSHEGPEEYVRRVRVHQNTMEHLVLFLPGLWLFSYAVDPIWAAGIGVLWPVGRLWYAFAYYEAAEKRGPGLYLSMPPIYIFVIGSLIGFMLELF